MLRKLVNAGAILLLITETAMAQSKSNLGIPIKQETPPSQEEIDRRKAVDKAYDATIQKIPDKKSSADPWAGVRPTSPATAKNKQQ
jgi:hypothetical protein